MTISFANGTGADWFRFVLFLSGILIFIFLADKTRARLNWPAEVTRKLVHVLTGLLVFFSPWFFVSPLPLISMALLFIVVNIAGIQTGRLKGMHDTSRRSFGTVFYPLSFLILVLFCWENHKAVMMMAMIVLAIADAAAAITGENLSKPHEYRLGRDKKSIEGSAVMAVVTFALVLLLLPFAVSVDGNAVAWQQAAGIALAAAMIATSLEALSSNGSDNLTTPLGTAFVVYMLLEHNGIAQQFYIGLFLALMMAVLSFRWRFLNASGSVSTFVLAALIFGVGGWQWTVPILLFFLLSSLLSKMGKKNKKQFNLMFEKSSCRDAGQVMANGGIAGSMIIGFVLWPHDFWYIGYLGALAAVTADTWGTEIGVFSKSQPVSVKTWRRVAPGTSGGITPTGMLAAFTGAWIIGLSGLLFSSTVSWTGTVMLAAAGVMGCLTDSLLGATIQAQYRCPACQKITERLFHCDQVKTRQIAGFHWLNNDWVNAFCALAGVVFAWFGFQLSGI